MGLIARLTHQLCNKQCASSYLKIYHRTLCIKTQLTSRKIFFTQSHTFLGTKLSINSNKGKNHLTFFQCGHISTLSNEDFMMLPVYLHAEKHIENTAIVDAEGCFTYAELFHHSMSVALDILKLLNAQTMKLNGERIAVLTERNALFSICQFGTWFVNGVSVPLCEAHPASEWEYFLQDAQCSLILVSQTYHDKIAPVAEKLGIKLKVFSRSEFGKDFERNRWYQPDFASNPKKVKRVYKERKKRWFDMPQELVMKKPALIVYTSGTTGPPKGVVLTHGNISAMVYSMIHCWGWTSNDVILHVLPLHHVHGIINILYTSLASGATCVMEPKFDAQRVWDLLTLPSIKHLNRNINLFMAVPTIYAKLIEYFEKNISNANASLTVEFIKLTTSLKIRLMVSGSAALPQPISEKWEKITGHNLLERYGMTEVGMALSNPLRGHRIPGSVGKPMPYVEVRIVKPNVYSSLGYDILAEGNSRLTFVTPGSEGEIGDLLVKGPTVFHEYWNKPEATAESFTKDGWFKTGDTAVYKNGVYSIIGRTSVDVIKSGGYKISALDVERHLLAHPDISDCAVVGLSDVTWGQKVAAVIVQKFDSKLDLATLREWAKDRLPPYQIPTVLKCLEEIPRNAMGKVNKKELISLVFPEYAKKKWF